MQTPLHDQFHVGFEAKKQYEKDAKRLVSRHLFHSTIKQISPYDTFSSLDAQWQMNRLIDQQHLSHILHL